MRARVEQPKDGRWMTSDPIWPDEPAYVYGKDSPAFRSDPFGDCNDCRYTYSGDLGTSCACAACAASNSKLANRVNDLLYHKIGPFKGRPKKFTNDQMNALRHCFWTCETTQECGCECGHFNDLKEVYDGGLVTDHAADLCNNCIGRELATSNRDGACLSMCLKELKRGRLCSLKDGKPFNPFYYLDEQYGRPR